MKSEYITLFEYGIGAVSIKYTEIVSVESTPLPGSRLTLSNGYVKIVCEDAGTVIYLIERTRKLNESN